MASQQEVIRSEVVPRLHAALVLLGKLGTEFESAPAWPTAVSIHAASELVRRSVEFLEEAE